ncbi:MAG: peptidoglycan O-acetyltransferase [Salibacteraceae bacterium]
MSFIFYGYWDVRYVPLLVGSVLVNYFISQQILKSKPANPRRSQSIFLFGICFNLGLLIYFKYSFFVVENLNMLTDAAIEFDKVVLPLAISFFTFQQIAFLVDSKKRIIERPPEFFNYTLFVSFFPQLIAGPIVHHKEMMPQFADPESRKLNYENIALGIYVFVLGLFKKLAIADTFAIWATKGFDITSELSLIEAWITSLSYSFQLYFDFSGYTDMAIGVALMFNIRLPINFNSPYKAVNIQDFWRRWHITLSRFLRDYIYIPLGGNRKGELRTMTNLFLTFLIGGIWHGAGWTFVFWGVLHGVALIFHRVFQKTNISIPRVIAVLLTFNFVNIAWVFFRANSWSDAIKVLKGMVGLNGIILPLRLQDWFSFMDLDMVAWEIWYLPNIEGDVWNLILLLGGFVLVWAIRNTNELADRFKPTWSNLLVVTVMMVYCLIGLNRISEFLYFQF